MKDLKFFNFQFYKVRTLICSRSFSSNRVSGISFCSEVFDLGTFDDLNKKSIHEKIELSKTNENSFVNFFCFGLRLRVTHNLISKGFIEVMNDNICFPNISLFFFNLTNLHLNGLKPKDLSNDDFISLEKFLDNNNESCDNSFLLKKYNIIYYTSLSADVCFNKSKDTIIRDKLSDDLFYSFRAINELSGYKIYSNTNIYLVYRITFDGVLLK